ncbi:MAG: hypothetical protein LBQ66_07565 [Planctomycetaceae bacterium]|jgi:hypothetical protein|nr:hypothetical protein [Planctomycetaceae bacterium]
MDKLVNTIISALVGGVVGAAVVFFVTGKTKFDTLEVRDLKITEQATLLSADKKQPNVLIKDGSVLVDNFLVGKRVVGAQLQGHVFVANRMLTTPDNVMSNANVEWKFYTEIGSTTERGGEVIVRSAAGAIAGQKLDKLPTDGWFFRTGYDDKNRPDISFIQNLTKEVMPVAILRMQPKQAVAASGDKTAADASNTGQNIPTPSTTIHPTTTSTNIGNINTPINSNVTSPPKQDFSSTGTRPVNPIGSQLTPNSPSVAETNNNSEKRQ